VTRSELANAHLFIKLSAPDDKITNKKRHSCSQSYTAVASASNLAVWMEFKRGQVDLGSVFVDHNAIRDFKGAGFYERRKKKHCFALDCFLFMRC
jgi:hypothetical protein